MRGLALLFATHLATGAAAQDLTSLSDTALLAEIAAATEAGSAEVLLPLMQEALRRGQLVLRPTDPTTCEIAFPDTPAFRNDFFRGAVRNLYLSVVWRQAIEDGHCGCAMELGPIDQVIRDKIGVEISDLSEGHLGQIRAATSESFLFLRRDYTDHRQNTCGDTTWR